LKDGVLQAIGGEKATLGVERIGRSGETKWGIRGNRTTKTVDITKGEK